MGADQHGIKPLVTWMEHKVTIGTQLFFLDFVVILLQKKVYEALLGREWLITVKVDYNWKHNVLSIESQGRKYVIDLRTQVVSEELASSDSEPKDREWSIEEGRERIKHIDEGVSELEDCLEDETSSLNGQFY